MALYLNMASRIHLWLDSTPEDETTSWIGGTYSMFQRYVCIRQRDMMDCGAAALATVALHYRRPIGLEQLRELAGTDRAGTNLLGLLRAAEKLGFSAKGVKGPYEALPQVPLPAIAHVRTEEGLGHFVVLYRVKQDEVVVADPAQGIGKQSREAFCQRWTGYLLILVPEHHTPPRCRVARWSARGAGLSACCAPTPRCWSRPSAVPSS